jgi:hypothetical protein
LLSCFILSTYSIEVIPLEVKVEVNLQAKSLKVYCEKFQPPLALHVSMSDCHKQKTLTYLPLYAIGLCEI